ncbi:hypothetical protein CQ12_04160 [Bradyrhizobium jicamae]|uniref:Glycosyl transferase family 1 domain-containing protein n=1 Tax=Bradyrhizobium jicamae TaxID=280332 RepID=A0A0R3KGL9_9BRAD|nr:glycosyltransferase family 4 protein [Bradyrhizobium jicamae]KRQ94849.1 hypothetical protein CQ12_04160 [Bradyrhizobium jicamae]
MRITFVLPQLNLSGGNKVVAIYSQELSRLGHTVTIIVPRRPSPSWSVRLRSLLRGSGPPALSSHFDGLDLRYIFIDAPRSLDDSEVPESDVIIATWWETAEWISNLSSSKGRKFYFVQHHEVFSHLAPRSKDTYTLPLRKIVVSKWLQDVMATEYGDRDVSLVPNSVDRGQFFSSMRSKSAVPTVGLLYSTVAFKGLDTSLAVIKQVQIDIPGLKIVAFGSEHQQDRLPLPNDASFFFEPSQDRIRHIYAQCDLWLTCSRTEGFNLPALEAMACGTPVVSTKAGWPADGVLDGVNGRLADVDDVNEIARAVRWVLTRTDKEWLSLSNAALETKTTASWAESALLFEKALFS